MAKTEFVSLQEIKQASLPTVVTPKRTFASLNEGSVLGAFNRLNKLIIPALAILALSQIPTAAAGPGAYAGCVALCTAAATPVSLPACLAGCTPFWLAPV